MFDRAAVIGMLLAAACSSNPSGSSPDLGVVADDLSVSIVGNDLSASMPDASCDVGKIFCDGGCVDPSADPNNCGGCAIACGDAQSCVEGSCTLICADGFDKCDVPATDGGAPEPTCVNLQVDNSNCGACGSPCAGTTCSSGICCGANDTGCPVGAATYCANLSTDNANCGACGTTCPSGRSCIGGQCGAVFSFTGAVQTFTVPSGVTALTVDVQGASGHADTQTPSAATPGKGGRVQAMLAVTPGATLSLYVGGQGGAPGPSGGAGGFNGGGSTSFYFFGAGGPGGGASDIRVGGTTLANRVVVAGGGGGSGWDSPGNSHGGDGGGLTGASAGSNVGGGLATGGTQSGGGAGATYVGWTSGATGGAGVGGAGSVQGVSGGGGGGYFGGGGGVWSGGGGGSSYTQPSVATAVTHAAGYRSGDGQIIFFW